MRILLLSPPSHLPGPIPKIVPLLVREFERLGHSVALEAWGRRREHETWYEKIVGRAADVSRIRRRLRHEDFDVLIIKTAHDWNTLSRDLTLLYTTKYFHLPTILHFHGSQPNLLIANPITAFARLTRRLLQAADGVFVLSEEEREQWLAVDNELSIHVVSNPYMPFSERFSQSEISQVVNQQRETWGAAVSEPLVLYVGRLLSEKGVFDLLTATEDLASNTNFRLVFAGQGPAENELRRRLASSPLVDRTRLTGYVEGLELAALYHQAQVVVVPTRMAEGFPTVAAEAMGAGAGLVCTPTRGLRDHLRDGENAIFVPPSQPTVLADGIRRLLTDGDLRERMRMNNLAAVKKFDPGRVARDYLAAVESVKELSGKNSRR